MAKYTISFNTHGRYITEVEAKTIKEAMHLAITNFSEADFGELSDADGDIYCVDKPDGETLYLR